MLKIGRNKPCPCGTGKKYKHCCAGKVFTWHEESVDAYRQSFPIEGRLGEVIEDASTTFVRHFGREPGEGDPILLTKYLLSPEDIRSQIVDAMERAGIESDKVYAYKKTGYLITNTNLDRATGAAIQEWDDAIEAFNEAGGDPDETEEGAQFDKTLQSLVEELESMIYLFGLASDKFFNTDLLHGPANSDRVMSVSQYQALCMTRTHRTLRSIRVLLKERMSDDAFKLARSMYENYLHVVYVGRYPDKIDALVEAPLGLRAGTHAYKTRKDGSEDKRVIVDKLTGLEYEGHISAYKMVEASTIAEDIPFFDFFYRSSSELLHPSVFALDAYLSEHGLSAVKPHMYEEGVIFSACISAMLAEKIPSIEGCPSQVARDCLMIVARVKAMLLELIELLSVWQERLGANVEDISLLQQRCRRLLNS